METVAPWGLRWAWCWSPCGCSMPMNRARSRFVFMVHSLLKWSLCRTSFWFPRSSFYFVIFLRRISCLLDIYEMKKGIIFNFDIKQLTTNYTAKPQSNKWQNSHFTLVWKFKWYKHLIHKLHWAFAVEKGIRDHARKTKKSFDKKQDEKQCCMFYHQCSKLSCNKSCCRKLCEYWLLIG